MSDNHRKEVYNALNGKDTEELLDIWQTNDRAAWTPLAFEVTGEILRERLGNVPPQNEPIYRHEEQKIAPAPEDGPVFYQPAQVLWLEKWLNRVAVAYIIITILMNAVSPPIWQYLSEPSVSPNDKFLTILSIIFFALVRVITVYFPLKALAFILKMLMQMEFNSRGAR